MEISEMKEKVAEACRRHNVDVSLLDKAEFRESYKGNIVCSYRGTDTVINPVSCTVLAPGWLFEETDNINEAAQKGNDALKARIEEIGQSEEFLKKNGYGWCMKRVIAIVTQKRVTLSPVMLPDSPVILKNTSVHRGNIPKAPTPEWLAEIFRKESMMQGLSESRYSAIRPKLDKMADSCFAKGMPGEGEGYFIGAVDTRLQSAAKAIAKGDDERTIRDFSTVPKTGNVRFRYAGILFDYDVKGNVLTYAPVTEMALNALLMLRKYRRPYGKITKAIGNLPHSGDAVVTVTLIGDGTDGDPCRYSVNIRAYGESRTIACGMSKTETDGLIKKAGQFISEAKKKHDTGIAAAKESLVKNGLYGSILAREILECVQLNRKFVTENIICKLLRNVKLNTEHSYRGSKNAGKFRLIPEDEVKTVIYRMTRANVLDEWRVDGRYCDYDALQLTDDRGRQDAINEMLPLHYGKDRKFAEYADADWEAYLSKTDPASLSDKYWTKLLPAFDHAALYCVKPELFVNFFSHCPDAFLKYLGLAAPLEEGSRKKLMRALAKEIKEKRKKG